MCVYYASAPLLLLLIPYVYLQGLNLQDWSIWHHLLSSISHSSSYHVCVQCSSTTNQFYTQLNKVAAGVC